MGRSGGRGRAGRPGQKPFCGFQEKRVAGSAGFGLGSLNDLGRLGGLGAVPGCLGGIVALKVRADEGGGWVLGDQLGLCVFCP